MADPCCSQIVGGKVYITAGDRKWECSGDVNIEPTNTSREAGATAGGELWITETAKPYRATMDLFNFCDKKPIDLFTLRCQVNIAVVEKSRKFMHLYTGAGIVGSPAGNLQSGVWTGIEIASAQYEVVDL